MIGNIGVTALSLLAIRPDEEIVITLVELCNNRIDMGAITILRKELLYFSHVLEGLSYDYQTFDEEGQLVPCRELNRYAKQLTLANKSEEEKAKLREKLEKAKAQIPHAMVLSPQQEIAGTKVALGGLERKIIEYYAENRDLLSRYLQLIDKNDVIHDVGVVFREKIYRLPNRKPVSLYYTIQSMLQGKKNMSQRDLDEIRSSALAIKSRFNDPLNKPVDMGDMPQFQHIGAKYQVKYSFNYVDDVEILAVRDELNERFDGVANGNRYMRALMELAADIFYFCEEEALLNRIFCPGEKHTLAEFEIAFKNLAQSGFFGLSLNSLSLYLDAIKTLSLIPDKEITFNRQNGYGKVIDTILAFCRCNELEILEEIKEEGA